MMTHEERLKNCRKIGTAILNLDIETARREIDSLYGKMLENYQILLESKRRMEFLRPIIGNESTDFYTSDINQMIENERKHLELLTDLSMIVNLDLENLKNNLENDNN